MHPATDVLSMGEVIDALNELTHGNAILVTDVGQHQMVTCRYAKYNQTMSNITSGGLGTMGFALPAAIGAKFGAPERTVDCHRRRRWISDDAAGTGNDYANRAECKNYRSQQPVSREW